MSQTERIFKLRQLLDAGRCVDKREVLQQLGISAATFKRDLAYLQDRLNTPVRFDRQQGGYRLERAAPLSGTQYVLPGLWLSAEEIHALLTMQHLLADLDTGSLLGPQIEPLMKRSAWASCWAAAAKPPRRSNCAAAWACRPSSVHAKCNCPTFRRLTPPCFAAGS